VTVVAICATLGAGCSTSSHSPAAKASTPRTTPLPSTATGGELGQACATTPYTSVYDKGGVRFTYPSCWSIAQYSDDVSSFSASLVDLSNQATHDPCVPITTPEETGSSCGWPVTRLAAGATLMRWSADGFPGWTLDKAPGHPKTVGGFEAREQTNSPGLCLAIGADETISVDVARSVADNYYAITACLRGPSTDGQAAQVQQILASTTFPNG
jgi:hypothetical protein